MIVARHINGITLNDYEYLLDEDGDVMEFDGETEAKDFLKSHGATDDDIDYLVFMEKCPVCGYYVPEDELKWSGNVLCCDDCAKEIY